MSNVQINISIPAHWKPELEKQARLLAVKEDRSLTYLDLFRRAVQEKYKLKAQKK